jgi:5-methylcytosine-specific restriction endonuclease McrA
MIARQLTVVHSANRIEPQAKGGVSYVPESLPTASQKSSFLGLTPRETPRDGVAKKLVPRSDPCDYVKIRSDVNPYDPKWELYLEARLGWQLSQTLAGRGRIEYLWKEQEGRCVICSQPLRIAEEDLHIHHRIWRSRGGPDTADNLEMLHANCHRQIHVQERLTKAAASWEGRS